MQARREFRASRESILPTGAEIIDSRHAEEATLCASRGSVPAPLGSHREQAGAIQRELPTERPGKAEIAQGPESPTAAAGGSAERPLRRCAIAIADVTVERGGRAVLKALSLTIDAGSVTVLVGPSGVGKTTFIGVLNGLIRPSGGSVEIAGLGPLSDLRTLRRHRLRTGTVFQEHALIDRLSALDNVLLGLADARHPLSPLPWPKPLRRQAALALESVGLLHRANAQAGRLSGGERQRVGIARALVRQPSLLLGDEPFSAVDPALTQQLGDAFRSLVVGSGATAVLALHHMEVARRIADRILGLKDGRIAFDGPPGAFDGAAQADLFPHRAAPPPSPSPTLS